MRRALSLALLLAGATPAWGFFNDRLELYASESITWDSNLFRLTDEARRSDRYHVHTLGVRLDLPVSLQRFEVDFARFFTRYQRFDYLDFNGHNVRAAWNWVVTDPRLNGDLGYTETTGLASFATFGGTERDVMTTRQAFASGNWELTPRWIAHAGLLATERKHDHPDRRIHNLEAGSVELRMSYVTPRESRIGLAVRVEEGQAPQPVNFAGGVFDNSYRHVGVGVVARWPVTANSLLDGRVDYVRREYEEFPQRDYSGPAWGITYTWTPTAKLEIVSTVRRDIAPLDDIQTAFVTATGASVRPRWQVTEKFAVLAGLDFVRWKYRGDPLRGEDFHHDIRTGGVGFAWTPLRRVVVTGNAQRESRRSSLGSGADYDVNVYTLDARVGF